MSLAMQPGFKAFSFRVGDTPSLGIILHGRHVRSQEIVPMPRTADVVSWTVGWPGGSVTKTTAANGGLTIDPRTRVIAYPVTEGDITALGGAIAPFAVQIIEASGRKTTYLTGTLQAQG